jgi:ribosomal protein L11 methylase PrmA
VLANILAPALVALAPDLRRVTAEQGRLVISGVLTGEYDHVVAALAPMRVVASRDVDGWSAVTLAHATATG